MAATIRALHGGRYKKRWRLVFAGNDEGNRRVGAQADGGAARCFLQGIGAKIGSRAIMSALHKVCPVTTPVVFSLPLPDVPVVS